MQRNYKQAARYEASPEQVHNRVARNKARRALLKSGKVRKGDNKDVAHKKALSRGGSNNPGNWKVEASGTNRSFKRTGHALKSEISKRESRRK